MMLRGLSTMQQASVCDGLSSDPFPLHEDCLAASEVDVGGLSPHLTKPRFLKMKPDSFLGRMLASAAYDSTPAHTSRDGVKADMANPASYFCE
jgi:hypothetical protein